MSRGLFGTLFDTARTSHTHFFVGSPQSNDLGSPAYPLDPDVDILATSRAVRSPKHFPFSGFIS